MDTPYPPGTISIYVASFGVAHDLMDGPKESLMEFAMPRVSSVTLSPEDHWIGQLKDHVLHLTTDKTKLKAAGLSWGESTSYVVPDGIEHIQFALNDEAEVTQAILTIQRLPLYLSSEVLALKALTSGGVDDILGDALDVKGPLN